MKFVELCNRLGIETAPQGHHHARHGWVNIDCPDCGRGTRKFHLGYNEFYGYANCWRCGKRDAVYVLASLSGKPYRQIEIIFKGLSHATPPKEKTRGRLVLPKGLSHLAPAHFDYLNSRGFNPRELERLWEIKGIGIASRLSWRIWIPINYQGRTVSWTTRGIGKDASRYVSASPDQEIIDQKTLIYGEDYIRNTIILVEGPTDVWNVGPGAGGLLGIGYTRAQLLKVVKYPQRVICFDTSNEAQRRARKLLGELSTFPGETLNCVLDAEDPGAASKREIKKLREAFLDDK